MLVGSRMINADGKHVCHRHAGGPGESGEIAWKITAAEFQNSDDLRGAVTGWKIVDVRQFSGEKPRTGLDPGCSQGV